MAKIAEIVRAIRRNLSDDLLKPEYRKLSYRKPTTGHCYVAVEALYHLLSLKQQAIYKPHVLKVLGTSHWYLMKVNQDPNSTLQICEVIDPTGDQFSDYPDYHEGRRCGFLTKTPSKRTLILLDRIKNGIRLHTKNIR